MMTRVESMVLDNAVMTCDIAHWFICCTCTRVRVLEYSSTLERPLARVCAGRHGNVHRAEHWLIYARAGVLGCCYQCSMLPTLQLSSSRSMLPYNNIMYMRAPGCSAGATSVQCSLPFN